MERHAALLDQPSEEERRKYLAGLRGEDLGGDREINALTLELKRQVQVIDENGVLSLSRRYPVSQGEEAADFVEKGSAIIYLLFHPIKNSDSIRAGHYDLLVKKTKVEPALAELTQKLGQQKKELDKLQRNFSEKFQTSFLRRDIMNVQNLGCAEVAPVVESICEIANLSNWFHDQETLKVIHDVFSVLANCVEVSGDPEKSIFRMNPVVILMHIFAYIVYYPVMIMLMVLLMLGRVQGWLTLITGFAGAAISAISITSPSMAAASQILGIITGILAAAKGVTLEQDYLYERVFDFTISILQRSFGDISKDAVFQSFLDNYTFEKFKMTIEIKKAHIEMVQTIRIFVALAIDTSLVQKERNVTELDRIHTILKLIEGVLMDPYNYKTLSELATEDYMSEYGFKKEDVKEIKEIYTRIITTTSFYEFMRALNEQDLPFPLVKPESTT